MPKISDLGGITQKQLQTSYWFVTHKEKLIHIAMIIIGVVAGALWLFALAGFFDNYVLNYVFARNNRGNVIQTLRSAVLTADHTKPLVSNLTIEKVGATNASSDLINLFARVTNPNKDYAGYFDGIFSLDGKAEQSVHAFIYPGETKYVLLTSSHSGSTVSFTTTNIRWNMLLAGEKQQLATRDNFDVKNIQFQSATQTGVSKAVPVSRVTFTLYNKSGYSYWKVGLPIVLLQNDQPIASQFISVDQIMAGESRTITATWFTSVGQPTSFVVNPEVDVFNPTVFMAPAQ